jgi:hypothetical protein
MTTPTPRVLNSNGAWCWFQDERALVDPERQLLVVGSIASGGGTDGAAREGDLDLNVVDLSAGDVQVVTLHEGFEADDHDVPALWRRPDGRWLAVYARHKTDDNTYWRISEVDDPTRWGEERVFDWSELTGGRHVTYSNLHEIDGRLFCFWSPTTTARAGPSPGGCSAGRRSATSTATPATPRRPTGCTCWSPTTTPATTTTRSTTA